MMSNPSRSVLPLPVEPAALPVQRSLLIAGDAEDRNLRAEDVAIGDAEAAARRTHLGQHRHGDAEQRT
jgi:hypothetical protein